jgi:hypothetical protein
MEQEEAVAVALTAAQTATPNPRNSESIVVEEEHKMKNPERLRAERQATNLSLFSSLVAEVFETDGTPFILFVKKGGSISPLHTAKKATIEKFVARIQRPGRQHGLFLLETYLYAIKA